MRQWLLIAFTLIVGAGLGFTAASLFQCTQQQETYPKYADSPDQSQQGKAALNKPTAERTIYKTPCEQPQSRDESDLCAQWRAANAAEKGDRSSTAQTIANWFGVIGLLATLIVSARAAQHASEAVEAAKDANRPWLELEIHTFEALSFQGDGNAQISVGVKVRNRGASPATHVLVIAALVPVPAGGGIDNEASVRKVSYIIDRLRGHDRQLGKTVFPSTDPIENVGALATKADIEAAEQIAPGQVIYQLGLGVRYRFGERTGRTVYGFTVVDKMSDRLVIPQGQDVLPEHLRFDDTFAGYAN